MKIPLSIFTGKQTVEASALIDSGADDQFIDYQFALQHRLPFTKLPLPLNVYNVDGTPNLQGQITHFTTISFNLAGLPFFKRFLITTIGKDQLILGLPWLQKYNPQIDWITGLVGLDEIQHAKSVYAPTHLWTFLRGKGRYINSKITTSQQLARTKNPNLTIDSVLPSYLQDLHSVFKKKNSERLPMWKPYDHAINLKPDFIPRNTKIYPLNPKEQIELNSFIDENLAKGYIRESKSPMASPFFFVSKKEADKL